MDAFATRASRTDKRIALDRLARARRRREIDAHEYRLRRQLARRAESLAELQALMQDVGDYRHGRDHWRYGRWRGPVRDGRELEIQRIVGALFLAVALLVVAACIVAAISLYEVVR